MEDPLSERSDDLLFGIRRSVRYHKRRQRFYELWHKITAMVGLFFGSSAMAGFADFLLDWGLWLPVALSCVAALIVAAHYAVRPVFCANLHADLGRRFIFLEQQFPSDRDMAEGLIDDLTSKRLDIEAAEPPPLRLLDAMCHFELLRAMGETEDHARIPWFRRATADLFSQASYAQNLERAR